MQQSIDPFRKNEGASDVPAPNFPDGDVLAGRSLEGEDLKGIEFSPALSGIRQGELEAQLAAAAQKEIELFRNNFREEAKPTILPGRDDRPVLLFYGGLGGTGWPWKEFAAKLNQDCGNRAEIYSLHGHDAEWAVMAKSGHQEWVNDIIAKADAAKQANGMAPVFFGFSTSAVAAVEAAKQRPDLFAALVLISMPIELKSPSQRFLLHVLDFADRYIPFAGALFERLGRALPADPEGSDPEGILSKQPFLASLPISSYIALSRLQHSARESLGGVTCPVLLLQGGKDKYVTIEVAERMFKMMASEHKEFVALDQSPHPIMLGPQRETAKQKMENWIRNMLGAFKGGESEQPSA